MREILIVSPPTPLSPVNPEFDRQPEFRWSAVAGAAKYEFYLYNIEDSSSTWIKDLTDPQWTPSSPLTIGRYYWQTVAEGANGRRSLWSAPTRITIGGQPTLLTPLGSASPIPLFTWTPTGGAAGYDLWVDRIGVQAGYLQLFGLHQPNYKPTTDLPTGTYRVWVRAISGTAEVSRWSLPLQFTVAEIDINRPLEPMNPVLMENLQEDDVEVADRSNRQQETQQPSWSMLPNPSSDVVNDDSVDDLLLDVAMSLVAVYGTEEQELTHSVYAHRITEYK